MSDEFVFAKLVPELLVTDLAASLVFWRELCGFDLLYDRPEEGFAYLNTGGAQVMLEERGHGRNWVTGALTAPLGRGVNFQIMLDDVTPILERLYAAGWPLFQACEDKWYRTGEEESGQRQFLVQDPDGYLMRFAMDLGDRKISV